MKKFIQSLLLSIFVMFTTSWACGQNGPTQPQVSLIWVQSDTTGIVKNNVYRCTGVGCIPAPPAIFTSTTPIIAWTDATTQPSTTYGYAVTASTSTTESKYSNIFSIPIPANADAPTNLTGSQTVAKGEKGKINSLDAKVIWIEKE
jgi:hypothetical protein